MGEEPLQILQVEAIETSIPPGAQMHGKPLAVAFDKFSSKGELIGEETVKADRKMCTRP